MENKKIITEELSRIKNLMGYDRSKTLNENINEGWFDTYITLRMVKLQDGYYLQVISLPEIK
jgi:hypothetical protein